MKYTLASNTSLDNDFPVIFLSLLNRPNTIVAFSVPTSQLNQLIFYICQLCITFIWLEQKFTVYSLPVPICF